MNDLKFAFRQLLKNPGFIVHPPYHLRRYCYGGRAVAVLTHALGIVTLERPARRWTPFGAARPTNRHQLTADV